MKGENVRGKIDSLMRYRDALDEGERELFDVLIHYANEVAMEVEQSISPIQHSC